MKDWDWGEAGTELTSRTWLSTSLQRSSVPWQTGKAQLGFRGAPGEEQKKWSTQEIQNDFICQKMQMRGTIKTKCNMKRKIIYTKLLPSNSNTSDFMSSS